MPMRFFARDFRALRQVDFCPAGVCLLGGANGSGKTSLLGVATFLRSAFQYSISKAVQFLRGPSGLRNAAAEPGAAVVLGMEAGGVRWEISLGVSGQGLLEHPGERVEVQGQVVLHRALGAADWQWRGQRRETPMGEERSCLKLIWDAEAPAELAPLVSCFARIRVYDTYWLNMLRDQGSPADNAHFLHPTGRNLFAVLRNWQGAPLRYRDQYAFVLRELKAAFPDMVDQMEFESVGHSVFGRFYPMRRSAADESLPFHTAADGLLTGLLHLTALAGLPDDGLLAIDEMENALHPFAIRSILAAMNQMAAKRNLTLLLSTHSPVLMNAFQQHPERFYVMEKGYQVLPVPLDQIHDAAWLAHFSLGELYDRLEVGAPSTVQAAGE